MRTRRYYRVKAVRLLAIAALSVTAGCAFVPATLELKPRVDVPSSNVGAGTSVALKFADERDDVTIGHRSVGTIGAKIGSEDLPRTVDSQLRAILEAKGYRLVSDPATADAEVIYRLRSFKFDIESGFFTGGRNASAALAVDARRRQLSYNNVYRFNSEQRILAVPGESEINEQMNTALNQILDKAASDREMDRFLTAR